MIIGHFTYDKPEGGKMFINIDNNFLRNILHGSHNNEILSPKEGLIIGNLFYQSYEPYKQYKPKALTPRSPQEELLLNIQALDLAVNDIGLYLNLNSEDTAVYEYYKQYNLELGKLVQLYNEKYEPLNTSGNSKDTYQWKQNWPWEVSNV